MLPSEISTQCWRSIGRWSCECHIVIITSCIRGCVNIRTSGHKLYIVQSYGTNIQTGFFKSIGTRLCISVSCGVAGVLDVSGILGDGSSASWCPEIISISSEIKTILTITCAWEKTVSLLVCFIWQHMVTNSSLFQSSWIR